MRNIVGYNMKKAYKKQISNRKRATKQNMTRSENGFKEAMRFVPKFVEAITILSYAKSTNMISEDEYLVRFRRAVYDLYDKCPNIIFFLQDYHTITEYYIYRYGFGRHPKVQKKLYNLSDTLDFLYELYSLFDKELYSELEVQELSRNFNELILNYYNDNYNNWYLED